LRGTILGGKVYGHPAMVVGFGEVGTGLQQEFAALMRGTTQRDGEGWQWRQAGRLGGGGGDDDTLTLLVMVA